MASAKKAIVREKVITYVDKEVIQLTLSVEEAKAVSAILASISGCSIKTHRKFTDEAYKKLELLGFGYRNNEAYDNLLVTGTLSFNRKQLRS